MAKLKDIKGSAIQYLAEDPIEYVGSWASGTSINTARSSGGSAGTKTSAIFFGGSPTNTAVESWDGSSWTEVAELNTARITLASTGLVGTEAIGAGGESGGPTTNVETWDGSTWTETTDMPVGTRGSNMFGSYTASVLTCGSTGTPGATSSTSIEWNGSSWTSITGMGTDRNRGAEAGLSTLGIIATGGFDPGSTIANVEEWNGSAWTEVSDVNTARAYAASSIAASYDSYIIAGGAPIDASPTRANTEFWNGSSWTEVNDLSTARRGIGRAGASSNSALAFGGYTGTAQSSSTEEWSFPPSSSTILQEGQLWFNYNASALKGYGKNAGVPVATWSSGGTMNTGRSNHFALGGLNDNLVTSPQGVVTTEQYNGTSWTALPSPANSGEGRAEGGSAGTATAGVIFGGWEPGASALTELWNGSSWTEVSDLNTGRNELAGLGISTSAFGVGGSPASTKVESWDGSSWTETTEINTGRGNMGGSGTTTDGLIFGGNQPNNAQTEFWDGTAWTEVGDLNTARRYGAAGGGYGPISIYAGGYTGSPSAVVESWNGSSWTEINDLSSADYSTKGAPAGNNTSTIVTGGALSNTTTEEFAADLTVATVTTS